MYLSSGGTLGAAAGKGGPQEDKDEHDEAE